MTLPYNKMWRMCEKWREFTENLLCKGGNLIADGK